MNWILKLGVVPMAAILLGSAVLIDSATAQSGGSAPLPAADAPPELVAAIDAYFDANIPEPHLNGDCSQIAATGDGGKWCWNLQIFNTSSARIGLAIANSDQGRPAVWFVRAADGSWAPGEPVLPPATGSGEGGNQGAEVATGVVAVAVLLMGVPLALAAGRRRAR